MSSDKQQIPTFTCTQTTCGIQWRRNDGYFNALLKGEDPDNSLAQFLKTAFIVEHGYFYLASVDSTNKRTWQCSVKNCATTEVE
jgi:hypothetical protein